MGSYVKFEWIGILSYKKEAELILEEFLKSSCVNMPLNSHCIHQCCGLNLVLAKSGLTVSENQFLK